MNSLLRTVTSMSNRRHMLIRESLQAQLNTAIIEIQSAPGVLEGTSVEVCDESLALCSALEAIFLHGLKDSLLNRVTEVLSGPDYDAMPQPSFWGPLLVFSHRQTIDQIQTMTQITTEVGYCRAWIRLALNEGMLSSYLAAIRRDNSALKTYYGRPAFIRDSDLVEVAQRLIESIDYIRFDLVCNSSLLNFWSSTPLLMAAIWSPPMKSCPVNSAVDIAKTISIDRPEDDLEEIETASSIGSLSSFNSSQNNLSGFSEDEAFKMILAKKNSRPSNLALQGPRSSNKMLNSENNSAEQAEEAVKQEYKSPNISNKKEEVPIKVDVIASTSNIGNSLIGKQSWSTTLEEGESSIISRTSASDAQTPAEGATYDALLKSYHQGSFQPAPNLEELLEKYPAYEPASTTNTDNISHNSENDEYDNFDEQLSKLAVEKGLDRQNYNCYDCAQFIGMRFAKFNVCGFTGKYFCCNCMSTEEFLIPARIIHNWDLKKYPVSKKAATYLKECTTLINLKTVNPKIYNAVDSMAQLQSLRLQLNLLRAYLFTCREPVIESFQKKLSPKKYLYEHVHQYSVPDFADILSGMLAQHLQKVVEFANHHVHNCWLCSQKGFICEVCNNPKVIYPFDIQSTYRCGLCHAVFHSDCLNASKPCPKCERRRKRMDLSLLDFDNSEIMSKIDSQQPDLHKT
ncbi:hypothetical protein TKK_0008980 [Trichogramma kaykai]|uniref:RUN domain-containing protein n=1 Tax=Trichogramma kaykai TaxID=54128 RepID=A0ABD2X2X7_9HYME